MKAKQIKSKTAAAILTFAVLTLGITSCKKPAGEGGKSSIRGSIWVEDWNSGFTTKNDEYPGNDEDVYIIYGDDISYGDKVSANYKGEFEFKFLRKGKYKIYVYSEDKTLTTISKKNPITIDVEISSKKEVKTLDRITIYK